MYASLLNLLLPLGVSILKLYIESSSSKKDDLILSTVQDGCKYLELKDNNTVNSVMTLAVNSASMKG